MVRLEKKLTDSEGANFTAMAILPGKLANKFAFAKKRRRPEVS
jgi:hypothetical protein